MKTIGVEQFRTMLEQGEACCIVDIRTLAEYREARLKAPSIHLPLDELNAVTLRSATGGTVETVYLLCRSEGRTRYAASQLQAEGVDNVVVVEGGLMACKAVGIEIE